MNLFYSLTDLASVADEQERARLLAAYPPLKTEPLYICNANVSRKEKNEIDGYMAEAGYTREEYEAVARAVPYRGRGGDIRQFQAHDPVSADAGRPAGHDSA